jgi:hypothetical protein
VPFYLEYDAGSEKLDVLVGKVNSERQHIP